MNLYVFSGEWAQITVLAHDEGEAHQVIMHEFPERQPWTLEATITDLKTPRIVSMYAE